MLRITNKLLSAVFSVVICIVSITPHISAYAETTTIPVPGAIYDTGEKGDYNISDDSITEEFNSFGTFSIAGDLVQTDNVGGIDVYTASSGSVDFNYNYSLSSKEDETVWHLADDSGKKIAGSKLSELVKELDSEEYFVENVSAVYVSNEYIEELEYNSQSNIYFGFTLEELDEEFQGTRYVFTLGDDGTTVVKPFEEYDDSYERVIKNVAVGTGVILICVTVSAVTAGAGAPAVGMIFAAAAKTGTTFALSSGTISFAAAAITTGIETGNVEEALKAGALTGSEAFKWGAITGAITGGGGATIKYTKAMQALKGVPLNGLTTQQAAAIQMESGYPVSIIKQFHSMDEYKIYKDAGLSAKIINNELALVRDIDLNYKYPGETMNNLERMKQGLAPYDPKTGKVFQLHHIGQKSDATLAILNEAEHQGNSAILNFVDKASEIDRDAFAPIRKKFWKSFAASVTKI